MPAGSQLAGRPAMPSLFPRDEGSSAVYAMSSPYGNEASALGGPSQFNIDTDAAKFQFCAEPLNVPQGSLEGGRPVTAAYERAAAALNAQVAAGGSFVAEPGSSLGPSPTEEWQGDSFGAKGAPGYGSDTHNTIAMGTPMTGPAHNNNMVHQFGGIMDSDHLGHGASVVGEGGAGPSSMYGRAGGPSLSSTTSPMHGQGASSSNTPYRAVSPMHGETNGHGVLYEGIDSKIFGGSSALHANIAGQPTYSKSAGPSSLYDGTMNLPRSTPSGAGVLHGASAPASLSGAPSMGAFGVAAPSPGTRSADAAAYAFPAAGSFVATPYDDEGVPAFKYRDEPSLRPTVSAPSGYPYGAIGFYDNIGNSRGASTSPMRRLSIGGSDGYASTGLGGFPEYGPTQPYQRGTASTPGMLPVGAASYAAAQLGPYGAVMGGHLGMPGGGSDGANLVSAGSFVATPFAEGAPTPEMLGFGCSYPPPPASYGMPPGLGYGRVGGLGRPAALGGSQSPFGPGPSPTGGEMRGNLLGPFGTDFTQSGSFVASLGPPPPACATMPSLYSSGGACGMGGRPPDYDPPPGCCVGGTGGAAAEGGGGGEPAPPLRLGGNRNADGGSTNGNGRGGGRDDTSSRAPPPSGGGAASRSRRQHRSSRDRDEAMPRTKRKGSSRPCC